MLYLTNKMATGTTPYQQDGYWNHTLPGGPHDRTRLTACRVFQTSTCYHSNTGLSTLNSSSHTVKNFQNNKSKI